MEKMPDQKEKGSKHSSKHSEWEGKNGWLAIPLFPLFVLISFFENLF